MQVLVDRHGVLTPIGVLNPLIYLTQGKNICRRFTSKPEKQVTHHFVTSITLTYNGNEVRTGPVEVNVLPAVRKKGNPFIEKQDPPADETVERTE
jgi:hypothetical protein